MEGIVLALCTSPKGGVPKYPQSRVKVAKFGFEGDYHCRAERRSFKEPGKMKPNDDRHITVVAEEALQCVNDALDLKLVAGSLAENILTRGLGDLSDVPPGAMISVNHGRVVLRVTGQNNPCVNLSIYDKALVKAIYGKRGLLCTVVSGVGEVLEPDCPIGIAVPL